MIDAELFYYDVTPSVVPVNRRASITLRPKGQHAAFAANAYYIVPVPLNIGCDITKNTPWYEGLAVPKIIAEAQSHSLSFEHTFQTEGEYKLLIGRVGEEEAFLALRIYALQDDLIQLRPFKIETHCHSCRSDGAESPEFLAAYYRQRGYDAMALTDHGQYEPSLEAMAALEGAGSDFMIFPGEEVHLPGNPVHIVNFAGTESINQLAYADIEGWKNHIGELAGQLSVPHGVEPFRFAACVWTADRIRASGGAAVLCHPAWGGYAYGNEACHTVPEAFFFELLRAKCFDAWELFGCLHARNNLHVRLFIEAARQGLDTPVLGANDSHSVVMDPQWSNGAFTIVLSPDGSRESLVSAIRSGRCVAVENHVEGSPFVLGPHRFMPYAQFLLDRYYPLYTRFAAHEGYILQERAAGNRIAPGEMQAATWRRKAFVNRFFSGDFL